MARYQMEASVDYAVFREIFDDELQPKVPQISNKKKEKIYGVLFIFCNKGPKLIFFLGYTPYSATVLE
jgi:hypothetical protein